MPHEVVQPDGITLSDDPARFDLKRAHRWISDESYWAQDIPFDLFATACANSLVVGAFSPGGTMEAMARVVTDRATFGWICDVFVDASCRGAGLGKALVAYLCAHPEMQGFRRLHLATRDAHSLYAQFGFAPLTKVENWMEIRRSHPYGG